MSDQQILIDSLRGELREEKEYARALEESKADAERLLSKKITELGAAEKKLAEALTAPEDHPASLGEGREPDPAHRREQAVNDLLALALIADDEEMKADLERLAARFSFPPDSNQKGQS